MSVEQSTRLKSTKTSPDLPISNRCWEIFTFDFLTELPVSKTDFDAVLVFSDQLSKQATFVSTKNTATAQDTAKIFEAHLFCKYGVPHTLVSDHVPKVLSRFWKTLTQLLNILGNISSSDHPQTDGLSENLMRTSFQASPTDWGTMLPDVEFQYNSSLHCRKKRPL